MSAHDDENTHTQTHTHKGSTFTPRLPNLKSGIRIIAQRWISILRDSERVYGTTVIWLSDDFVIPQPTVRVSQWDMGFGMNIFVTLPCKLVTNVLGAFWDVHSKIQSFPSIKIVANWKGEVGKNWHKNDVPSFEHQIFRHTPKVACVTNFLADSKRLWAGLNMHTCLFCCNIS